MEVRPWIEFARIGFAHASNSKHGTREAALAAALAEIRIRWPNVTLAKQTLRTAMAALDFVGEKRQTNASDALTLESLPAIVVETLRRWHTYDAEAAMDHARQFAAGDLSIRDVMDMERDARRKPAGMIHSGRSGRSIFEDNLKQSIQGYSAVGTGLRVVGLSVREPVENERRAVPAGLLSKVRLGTLTLDEAARQISPGIRSFDCALLVAGPYADAEVAVSRLSDWALRALGLTFYFPTVALVLANARGSRGFVTRIPPAARGRLLVLAPDDAG